MILDSLYIKNFRLFKELEIERLGRVNLIVGKNNSGKTCLLEALWIYGSRADEKVLKKIISSREEDWENHKDSERHLRYNYEKENFFIGGNNHGEKYWYRGDNFLVRPLPTNVNSVQFIRSTYLESEEVDNLWNDIYLTPHEQTILEALHLIDKKIEKIGLVIKDNRSIPVIFRESKRLPLKNLGEGMTRVFHIALALVNAGDGFLLIDEFENGLHYTIQPKVWELVFKLAKELNVQVFATTHSWDCVTAFQQAAQNNEEEIMLFRLGRSVRKSDNGKVIVTAYNQEELEAVTQAEWEVR